MTTINLTEIPSDINTAERLAAYIALLLDRLNPTKTILEVPNGDPVLVADTVVIQADDGTQRLIVRLSLELDPAFVEDKTQPLWMHTKELSNVAIPAGFKQGA